MGKVDFGGQCTSLPLAMILPGELGVSFRNLMPNYRLTSGRLYTKRQHESPLDVVIELTCVPGAGYDYTLIMGAHAPEMLPIRCITLKMYHSVVKCFRRLLG